MWFGLAQLLRKIKNKTRNTVKICSRNKFYQNWSSRLSCNMYNRRIYNLFRYKGDIGMKRNHFVARSLSPKPIYITILPRFDLFKYLPFSTIETPILTTLLIWRLVIKLLTIRYGLYIWIMYNNTV